MGLRGLEGRVAVIVGGASGLGAATALRLGVDGCRVIVPDNAMAAAQRVAEALRRAGGQASALHCDLADPASVRALFARVADDFGGVDATLNVGADMTTLPA